MSTLSEKISQLCAALGVPDRYATDVGMLLAAVGFVLLVFVVQRCVRFVLVPAINFWAKTTKSSWDDVFCEANFPRWLAHVAAAIVAVRLFHGIFQSSDAFDEIFRIATGVYFAVSVAGTLCSVANAAMNIFVRRERFNGAPVKGIFQALKVLIVLAVAIWIVSILSDKSPAYFLSAIGALTAIILIVFKDALLGFTAGILISTNDLVRTGDWIEIPGSDVDGQVQDVSLTTVKVKNWDNTVSCVPAYTLVSTAFKNWRGMSDSGGRRIKRSIFIDMQTIRFATDADLRCWEKIELLKPYLARKREELAAANARVAPEAAANSPANVRALTNLGTFRAYCTAYLRASDRIRQEMILVVRQRDPAENGLPLEIYAFAADTNLAGYENIQSDIFDHLLAVVPEFGLRVFQAPSGRDIGKLAENVPADRKVAS